MIDSKETSIANFLAKILSINMEIISFLQSFATPWLDKFFLLVTHIGSEQVFICLLITIYLAFDSRIGQRLGIYSLLGYYLNFHLKGLFDTPRPFELDSSVLRSAAAGETGIGAGIPSGHAQGSMTFWGLLAFYFNRKWLYPLCALIIILVALSRIYLGVHFPIDVLAGLLIGAVIVVLALVLDHYTRNLIMHKMLLLLLGLTLPFLLHLFLPTEDSEKLLGSLAAFITGPTILRHRAKGGIVPRFLTALLGLVLVFGVLVGSSLLIPESIKSNVNFGFLRYLIIGYTATLLAPWLAKRIGLM